MAVTLPTFADLPSINPRAAGGLPTYPESDPGAVGLATFGKGVAAAGGALEDIAADDQRRKDKLEQALATTDLFTRLTPLHEQISKETDPGKLAELRGQYNTLLDTSGGGISNPYARQMWAANHSKTIAQAHADADARNTVLDRNSAVAQIKAQIDNAVRVGAGADDPQALPNAKLAIRNSLEYAQNYGSLLPTQAYELSKAAMTDLVAGRIDSLIAKNRINEASALLEDNRTDLGGVMAAHLEGRLTAKAGSLGTDAAATRALGLAPPLPARSGGATDLISYTPSSDILSGTGLTADQYQTFRSHLASRESGSYAQPPNAGGYAGRYQMGRTEIQETATRLGVPVPSQQQFLSDPQLQERFLENYTLDHHNSLMEKSAAYRDAAPSKKAAILMGAHLGGVGGVTAYLDSGGKTDPADANGTRVSDYVGSMNRAMSGAPAAAGDTVTASTNKFDMAGGDSIGVGFIRAAKLGGQAVDSVTMPEAATAEAAGSRNPQQALDFVKTHPENFQGKTVLWSSGLMNAGATNAAAALPIVGAQLDALKAAGANVVLAGVDTGKFSDYNAGLAKIAADHGVPFAGPLPTDNVHPGPQGYRDYAAGAVKLIPTGPAALGAPAPAAAPGPPTRTGLPVLTEVYQRLAADPTLTNEKARDDAFRKATIIHNAMEADAARSERLQVQQQSAAMKSREDQIWADAYSPTPKITALQIAVDPAFAGNPERRKQMIELVNNPPGSGVPAAQSYAAAQALISRIRLPDGDPNKISDVGPIYDAGAAQQINKGDFEFVKKQLDELSSVGGEKFARRKADFIKAIEPQIDKSAFSGIPDLKGKSRLYEFQYQLDQQIDEYRKAGKNPADLLNPSKPDYVGKPEALAPYKRTLDELIADMPGAGAAKLDISTPDKLKAAVAAGTVTRDQGEAEALRQGWIRAAAPPIPTLPPPAAAPIGP